MLRIYNTARRVRLNTSLASYTCINFIYFGMITSTECVGGQMQMYSTVVIGASVRAPTLMMSMALYQSLCLVGPTTYVLLWRMSEIT